MDQHRNILICLALLVAGASSVMAQDSNRPETRQPNHEQQGPPPATEPVRPPRPHEQRPEGAQQQGGRRMNKGRGGQDNNRPVPLSKAEHEELRQAIDQLPEKVRQLLWRNLRTMQKMPPERKEALRDYAEMAKERIIGEIDVAVKANASSLSEADQKRYRERYIAERRKLENRLRENMSASRKAELPAIHEKLRVEFNLPASSVQETPDTGSNVPDAE